MLRQIVIVSTTEVTHAGDLTRNGIENAKARGRMIRNQLGILDFDLVLRPPTLQAMQMAQHLVDVTRMPVLEVPDLNATHPKFDEAWGRLGKASYREYMADTNGYFIIAVGVAMSNAVMEVIETNMDKERVLIIAYPQTVAALVMHLPGIGSISSMDRDNIASHAPNPGDGFFAIMDDRNDVTSVKIIPC